MMVPRVGLPGIVQHPQVRRAGPVIAFPANKPAAASKPTSARRPEPRTQDGFQERLSREAEAAEAKVLPSARPTPINWQEIGRTYVLSTVNEVAKTANAEVRSATIMGHRYAEPDAVGTRLDVLVGESAQARNMTNAEPVPPSATAESESVQLRSAATPTSLTESSSFGRPGTVLRVMEHGEMEVFTPDQGWTHIQKASLSVVTRQT